MANHTADEATQKHSQMGKWVRNTAILFLSFVLGMLSATGITFRGDDGSAVVWTLVWAMAGFGLLTAVFLNGLRSPSTWWKKLREPAPKAEEVSNDPADLGLGNADDSNTQPTDPDNVTTEKLPTTADDPSKERPYQLGQQDFHEGKNPRTAEFFPSRKEHRTYMTGYSAAMYDAHLPEGGENA